MLMLALISQLELRLILPSQPQSEPDAGDRFSSETNAVNYWLARLGGKYPHREQTELQHFGTLFNENFFGNLFKGPETNVFHHEKLGLFAGVLAGKKLKSNK